MKYLVIIFGVCIASSIAAKLSDGAKAVVADLRAACIAETKVSLAAIDNAKKGNFDKDDAKIACFAACFLKKLDLINAEDQFDEAAFRAQIPADIPSEKVDAVIKKCNSQVGASICETGAKLMKCYWENKIDLLH